MKITKNKKIILYVVCFVVLIILSIFIKKTFFDAKPVTVVNSNKTITKTVIDDQWNEQITAKVTEVFNSWELKKTQESLKIPKSYDPCKEDTNMIWCIVFYDKDKKVAKKFITDDFVENKLNEIDSFKENLLKEDEDVEDIIADELQEYYTLSNPSMIFETFNCENKFCEKVIIKTKKIVLWRMVARQELQKTHCGQIPEKEVKTNCTELFGK